MSPAPSLQLRQSQSLVMTAQLQQSIKLLQLSTLELQAFIEQELEKNPLLTTEDAEPQTEKDADADTENTGGENQTDNAEERVDEAQDTAEKEYDSDNSDSTDNESDFDSGSQNWEYTPSGNGNRAENGNILEQTISETLTLRDHLLAQLQADIADPVQRIIGVHLIDLVNESGYILEDLQTVAARLGTMPEKVEETLLMLQHFDPSGVCARNLSECLALQLREKNRLDPAMQALLENLEPLGRGDYEQLKKICQVDREDLADMHREIRALNPKPGSNFAHEFIQQVVPDAFLRLLPGGQWQVELNNEALPRVLVNRRYYARLQEQTRDKTEKKFLSDQLATANWLMKALDQRAHTLLKVTTDIVQKQSDFFHYGIAHLAPLTLKQVAQETGFHESTVSRVTSGKFIHTPRGMFELKYFFTSSLQNLHGGEDISSKVVQHMINEVIQTETGDAILSDDDIADLLKAKGVEVARRTVAKYREMLHIGSSVQRRRAKKSFA